MMKRAILFSLFIAYMLPSYARISVRPEIGINLSNATIKLRDNTKKLQQVDTKYKTGGTAGIHVKIILSKNFYLQPGIIYSNLGYDQKDEYYGRTYEQTTSLNYIHLPLDLGYSFNIRGEQALFITMSPYLGCAVGGKIKRENELDYSIIFGNSTEDDLKKLDAGIKLGIGYQTGIGIFCHIQYILGTANLFPDDDWGMFQNRGFSLSIGYDIPIKM